MNFIKSAFACIAALFSRRKPKSVATGEYIVTDGKGVAFRRVRIASAVGGMVVNRELWERVGEPGRVYVTTLTVPGQPPMFVPVEN